MKTNREKFLKLVSDIDIKAEERINWRIANRQWLRVSQSIGFDILEKLDDLDWTQKDLAEKMCVSPQYINKIVKGKENFTLETLVKLQEILDIPILANYYKQKQATPKLSIFNYPERIEDYSMPPSFSGKSEYRSSKVMKIKTTTYNSHQEVIA
jgi:transcriptional regulator with XRE-family HTH domain